MKQKRPVQAGPGTGRLSRVTRVQAGAWIYNESSVRLSRRMRIDEALRDRRCALLARWLAHADLHMVCGVCLLLNTPPPGSCQDQEERKQA